jgi:hypothetical protein
MGDLVQFPEGGRRKAAPAPPEVSVMFCAACGKERRWHVAAAYPGPCECGGRVFTSDPNLGVGAADHVQVLGVVSSVPVEVVTGPVQVTFGDPALWTFGNGS